MSGFGRDSGLRVRASLVVLAVIGLPWLRSAWESRAALRHAAAAESAGRHDEARESLETARLWRCPLCPWAARAEARLRATGVGARASLPRAERPLATGVEPSPWLSLLAGVGFVGYLGAAAAWAWSGRARPWGALVGVAAVVWVAALALA